MNATYQVVVAEGESDNAQEVLTSRQIAFNLIENAFILAADQAVSGLQVLLSAGITIEHYDLEEANLESVFLAINHQEADYASH